MLNDDIISSQTAITSGAGVAATDELMLSDNGVLARVDVQHFADFIYSQVSGDATIANAGALTIAASAVEASMLNDNVISGQDELLAADISGSDELMISDAGVLKRTDAAHLADFFYANVSGDATIAAGGALTIAADAVEGSMLNDDIISSQTAITSGAGVAATDELMLSDGGVLARVDVQHLADFVYSQVSGDATIANAGALTLSANAVEGSMINSNVAGDGLKYGSNALNIEPNDFAGTGLEDDGSDNLAVSAAQTSITSILNDSFCQCC